MRKCFTNSPQTVTHVTLGRKYVSQIDNKLLSDAGFTRGMSIIMIRKFADTKNSN